jgi:hypothetical protein
MFDRLPVGSAINAAVALENQLLSMFGPLLSLATIIRFDPYYPNVNASFDSVAQQLLDQVSAASSSSKHPAVCAT